MSFPDETTQDKEEVTREREIIQEKILHNNGEVEVRKYLKGRFLIKGFLSRSVRELTDIEQNKIYTGKIVPKSQLTRQSRRNRLVEEIRIHRSLHHKSIIQFERFFEDEENVYILYEFSHEQTLNNLLKRRKRMSEQECVFFMTQIIQALKYLHEKNIVHRDLKLGNLWSGNSFEFKLDDFSMAAKIEHEGEKLMEVCGTSNYIAPEILKKEGHSFEVDIWALGVICYALLIGRPPFETCDVRTTYQKILKGDYSFPESVPISEEAKDLILKILVLDPAKRLTLKQIEEHPFMRDNPVKAKKEVFVSTWVDHSARYGLGSLLSDGKAGALFLDSTRIVMPENVKGIEDAMKQQDQATEERDVESSENYSKDLEKKVLLK